jgi:DNA primase
MAPYSSATLDEIRARIDLVELVEPFVTLKKAGAHWKGLCPFHAEKTPSFMVNPHRGIFHCFGCGVGGDAFGFLMRQDRLSFPEAVRALAERTGVVLPSDGPRRTDESGKDELYRALEAAACFYGETLWAAAGDLARRYLTARGVDPAVARRFRLGYAPGGWSALLTFMRDQRFADETLERAGLVVARDSAGGFYDRFRGRLMFPIKDPQGRVIGFGGRALADEEPKYLNSPESALYSKGQVLYGMDGARESIRARNRALLVEGYLDCLMAHQHGFTETVAALGTAFTGAQLALLRRHTSEVVTFFDADAAGHKAAQRAEELLELTTGNLVWALNRREGFAEGGRLRVKVALLPAGYDPDTFLRAQGADAFSVRITAARNVLSYAIDRVAMTAGDASTPRARPTAFAQIALILSKVADSDEAVSLAHEAAVKLGIDETQLWIHAQEIQRGLRGPTVRTSGAAPVPETIPLVERDLLALLLHLEEARERLLPRIDETDLTHAAVRSIVEGLKRRPAARPESLLGELAGESERGLLAALLVEERAFDDAAIAIAAFETRFDLKRRRRRIRQVSRAIAEAQAGGAPALPELESELRALQRESEAAHVLTLGVHVEPGNHGGPSGLQGVRTNG